MSNLQSAFSILKGKDFFRVGALVLDLVVVSFCRVVGLTFTTSKPGTHVALQRELVSSFASDYNFYSKWKKKHLRQMRYVAKANYTRDDKALKQ